MRKWLACLKGRRGTAFPPIIATTLARPLILRGIIEFFRLNLTVSGVKGALQDAVVVVVNDSCANVYHGVREGYSGGYYTGGCGLEEWVDTGDIYYHLDETLGTQWEGGSRVKCTGSALEYKIIGLDVTIRNASLALSGPANAQRFEIGAVAWLEVPVRFTEKAFPIMRMKLKVQAGYIGVF